MEWRDRVAKLAESIPRGRNDHPNHEAVAKALRALVDGIADTVMHGGRVEVPGLGTFVRRVRKARTGRHPITGEPIALPEVVAIGFVCSKTIKR